MNELMHCRRHNVQWSSGGPGCEECRKESINEYHRARKESIPKTKLGKIWPIKDDPNYGK